MKKQLCYKDEVKPSKFLLFFLPLCLLVAIFALIESINEMSNENGEKVTFKTPELNGNPEKLDIKEVTVYSFDSVRYTTDFGYIDY